MNRYQGKKILLMGLGGFVKGSGVSAAEFLARAGADLTITDLKSAKELSRNLRRLKKFKNIKYVLGEHREKDFKETEWVVRNPDVPPSSPFLDIARRRGIFIDNDITLFFREYGVEQVIGVTGTRGKSTTASLIYEMVRQRSDSARRLKDAWQEFSISNGARQEFSSARLVPTARLGGNIGESPLRFLDFYLSRRNHEARLSNNCHSERNEPSYVGANGIEESILANLMVGDGLAPVVLELSNFQLSDLDTIKMSPRVAVWTNLYPDHLNKYSSIKEYISDKEKIFKYQKAGDAAVLNWDNEVTRRIGKKLQNVLFFSLKKKPRDGAYIKNGWFMFVKSGKETRICKISDTKLLGEHNLSNTLAAICAARSFGAVWPAIKAAIKNFNGVPNRLELVKIRNGVKFINDCAATSPEATIAALKSFPAGKMILISGGNSKGSPLKEMARFMAKMAKAIILMPGKVNEELRQELRQRVVLTTPKRGKTCLPCLSAGRQAGRNLPLIFDVKSLKEAINQAVKIARKGDVVLFSPGLTWLPRQNEFARGEEFKRIIKLV